MRRRTFLKNVLGAVASFYVPAQLIEFAALARVTVVPTRQDLTVLPEEDLSKLKLGWVIYEEVGIVVVNDMNIERANFG